jgi:hypothetical protein
MLIKFSITTDEMLLEFQTRDDAFIIWQNLQNMHETSDKSRVFFLKNIPFPIKMEALVDEEVLEEQVHEESCQEKEEGSEEAQHVENPDETLLSILPLDEDEVIQPFIPSAHENEEVIKEYK